MNWEIRRFALWRRSLRQHMRPLAYLCCSVIFILGTIPASGVSRVEKGEWRFYGGDPGNTKYSPLDQINADNVKTLKAAWTWDSPDLKLLEQNQNLYTASFEGTPLMVGGT